jgi:hypothetical protein
VYDGHGGTGVANYLKDHLHEFILAQAEYRSAPQSYLNLDGVATRFVHVLVDEVNPG